MVDVERLAALLIHRNLTVAAGESATGGLVSYLLSSPSGASRYFLGGVTAYANEAKAEAFGVSESDFAGGAVSEAVVASMASGARDLFHADIGVADTGIAGPGGATPTKPVGLFYVAISAKDGHEMVRTHHFTGNRDEVRHAAADAALALLMEYLDALPTGQQGP